MAVKYQEMPIEQIRFGERIRQDLGDVKSLAVSIEQTGLRHPIQVLPDGTLVSGFRRIEAYKLLGRTVIPATVVVDLSEASVLLEAERQENTERKPFTPTEIVRYGRILEEIERPLARERKAQGGREGADIRRGEKPPKAQRRDWKGRVDAIVGRAVGVSETSYQRAKRVIEAAETDPKRFGDLAETMERTGNITGTHSELLRRQGRPHSKVGSDRSGIIGRTTIKPHRVPDGKAAEHMISSLRGISIALDGADWAGRVNGEVAEELVSTITATLSSLRKLRDQLKEQMNG